MKILIFSSGYENLGLEYISASLKKKGYEVLLEFDNAFFNDGIFDNRFLKKVFNQPSKYIAEKIVYKSPELVLFSSMTDNIRNNLDIARNIKNISSDIGICFGGIHPTLLPKEVLKHDFVDYVCVGEGEKAVVKRVDASKEEITVELYESVLPIPITVRGDHVRVIDRGEDDS